MELVEFLEGKLTIRYEKGVNEECPECVPDHTMVQHLMVASLNVHAPHVQVEEV